MPNTVTHEYEVIVGNIGIVYSGSNGFEANTKYQTYVGQSKSGYGRAAYEEVTLMRDGDVRKEYIPEPLFNVYWSPEGRVIATVRATSPRAAIRKAPLPYRKYLGEMYAELVNAE